MAESMGVRIHAKRKELRLSLRALGSKVGLTAAFLCDLEKSKRGCSIESAGRIAAALGVQISWLIGESPAQWPQFVGSPSIKFLAEAAINIAAWLEWDRDVLEDAHRYGKLFGTPGENVYRRILEDALALRGMTLAQLREAPHA